MSTPPSGESGEDRVSGNTFNHGIVQIGHDNVQHIHQLVQERREFEAIGRLPEVGLRIGRKHEVRQALDWLAPKAGVRGPLIIHGPAGSGKSHLAYAVAQEARRAGWFDAEIRVMVGNQPAKSDDSLHALNQVLRMLEPESRLSPPQDMNEARARYLSRLGRRRVLVLVDGATHADQVSSLVPPAPGRLVVTSRAKLTSVDPPARHLGLGPLPPEDAVALLAAVLGTSSGGRDARITGDPAAAAEVAGLCDRLPLALMLAAQVLVVRDRMTVRELRDRLADRSRRLTELEDGARGVRAALEESYRLLSPLAQALLLLLPLHPGPYIGADAVAVLARIERREAEELLHALYYLRFLEHTDLYQGGFRFQDLVLLYAEELARKVPEDQRDEAEGRLLRYYVAKTRRADVKLTGGSRGAMAWLDAERPNLVAAVLRAGARPRLLEETVKLTLNLTDFFDVRKHWDDWVRTHRLAAGLAQAVGGPDDESWLLECLGRAYHQQKLISKAYACYTQAAQVRRDGGRFVSPVLTSLWYRALCDMYDADDPKIPTGDLEALLADLNALQMHGQSSSLKRSHATALSNLGIGHIHHERVDEALACLDEARLLFARLGDKWGEGRAWLGIGNAYDKAGKRDEARAAYKKASACFAGLDDFGQGQAEYNLADLYIAARNARMARQHLDMAARCFAHVPSNEGRQRARQAQEDRRNVRGPVVRWKILARRRRFDRFTPLPVVLPPLLVIGLVGDNHRDTPERLAQFTFPLPDPHAGAQTALPEQADGLPDRGLSQALQSEHHLAVNVQEPLSEDPEPSDLLAELALTGDAPNGDEGHTESEDDAWDHEVPELTDSGPFDYDGGHGGGTGWSHDGDAHSTSPSSHSGGHGSSHSGSSHDNHSGHDSDSGGHDSSHSGPSHDDHSGHDSDGHDYGRYD